MTDGISRSSSGGIDLQETYGWKWHHIDGVDIWLKGYLYNNSVKNIASFLTNKPSREEIALFLNQLDGHFALAASFSGEIFAAVDRVRSIPLFYAEYGGGWHIDDQSQRLCENAGITPAHINQDARLCLSMGGFTIGRDTLYYPLHQLSPGDFVVFSSSETPHLERYYSYVPRQDEKMGTMPNTQEAQAELAEVTLDVFRKLIASAEGRTIAIPLSAGCDSRLVASALTHLGYKNIKCFSYGQKSNFEIKAAKLVADRLGLEWRYIEFTSLLQKENLFSDLHDRYLAFADSNSSVPFEQDFLAIRSLKDTGWLPENSIIVNGNSGDYISGNHIAETFYSPSDELTLEQREEKVLDALVNKHFSLWQSLKTPENIEAIKLRLRNSFKDSGVSLKDGIEDYSLYEFSEFQDRQCKYVITGQRIYEFFGFDWRLPLWDNDYLDYWEKAPLTYKVRQNLYLEMLRTQNWGGVWQDVPINLKTIRPRWVMWARLIAKVFFVFSKKSDWHDFQNRYFAYFMEPLCLFEISTYKKMRNDTRGFRNVVSYLCEHYLSSKNINLSESGHVSSPDD